jgi:hypothetical protein
MIQVVLHHIMLVDRGQNKCDVSEADQVLHDNLIPGQLGIFVVLGGDADMNSSSGRKRIYPLALRATCFCRCRKRRDLNPSTDRGRKLISPIVYLHIYIHIYIPIVYLHIYIPIVYLHI